MFLVFLHKRWWLYAKGHTDTDQHFIFARISMYPIIRNKNSEWLHSGWNNFKFFECQRFVPIWVRSFVYRSECFSKRASSCCANVFCFGSGRIDIGYNVQICRGCTRARCPRCIVFKKCTNTFAQCRYSILIT